MSAPLLQHAPSCAFSADPKQLATQDLATRQLALLYAHRLLVGTSLRQLRIKGLAGCKTLVLLRRLAGLRRRTSDPAGAALAETPRPSLRRALMAYLKRPPTPDRPETLPTGLQRNLTLCASLMGLTQAETAVLRFGLMLQIYPPLRSLLTYYGEANLRLCADFTAAATGLSFSAVRPVGFTQQATCGPDERGQFRGVLSNQDRPHHPTPMKD